MECTAIEFEVSDHVATITLNRPEQYNAFNDQMAEEINWAWETIRDTDSIHVAVLQANGEKAFCTGVDIKGGATWFMKDNVFNSFDPGVTLSPKFHHKVWKPVVVAVHGLCAGGAMYFLNEADIILCADDSEFFDPHANGGIVSALEPIGMAARGVALGDVLRWALMGNEERITPETALRIGLVSEVVPRAELRQRARVIALSIADRNPTAIQGTVRAIWEAQDLTRTAALERGLSYAQIGNPGTGVHPSGTKTPPTYR